MKFIPPPLEVLNALRHIYRLIPNSIKKSLFIFWMLFQACNSGSSITNVPVNINGVIKINSWTAIGPFRFDTVIQQPQNTLFNNDLIAGGLREDAVNRDNVGKLRRMFHSRNISEHDGFINLFEYVKDIKTDKSNFYLFTVVNSETDQEVVFAFDYAAATLLWLNGDKIYEGHHKEATPRKLEYFIKVRLKKGKNDLMLKMNREGNVVAWKFVFYITSLQYAKELYKANYIADFVNNPNVLKPELSIYAGPYTGQDIKAFYIAPSWSEAFIKRPLSEVHRTSNFTTNVSDLSEGFYRCRILLDKDTLEETIYKGSLFELENVMKKDTIAMKMDTAVRNELNMNIAKFQGQLWNSGNIASESNQRERQKKCIFYGYTAAAAICFLRDGNISFRNMTGTYAKTYFSQAQLRPNAFLFHVNKALVNRGEKLPLVLIIPWSLPAEDFIFEGYYDAMPQIEADIMLADKYGFAVAWPFLRKGNNVWRMKDDIKCVLSQLRRDYNIDTNNIYLLGDSEGSKRVLMIAASDPAKYKALALFVPDWTEENSIDIAGLKNTSILVARAKEDKYSKDIALSFIETTKKSGGNPVFMEYEGGHEAFRKDHRWLGFNFFSDIMKK